MVMRRGLTAGVLSFVNFHRGSSVNLVDSLSCFLTRAPPLRVVAHGILDRADKRIRSQSLSGQRCWGARNRDTRRMSTCAPRIFLSRMVAATDPRNPRHKTLIQSTFSRARRASACSTAAVVGRVRAARLIRFCCAAPNPRVGSPHFDGRPRSIFAFRVSKKLRESGAAVVLLTHSPKQLRSSLLLHSGTT